MTTQKPKSDKSEVRSRLLVAAEKIIVTEGLSSASIRNIARQAETNSALVSYYFANLAGLIRDVGTANLELMLAAWEHHYQRLPGDESLQLRDILSAYIRPLWINAAFNESERGLLVLDEIVGHGEDVVRTDILAKLAGNFHRAMGLLRKARPDIPVEVLQFRIRYVSSGCLGVPPRTGLKALFLQEDVRIEKEVAINMAIDAAVACLEGPY